jgi:hypothetical protein
MDGRIRAGLAKTPGKNGVVRMKTEKIPSGRREVRKFGFLFAVIGLLLAAYLLYKGSGGWRWTGGVALFFLLSGLFAYPVLRPIYIGWMKFAFVLGWVNTRVILSVFFYLVITPVGLVMRLFGRDPMNRKFDRSVASYWVRRPDGPTDHKRYENLF